MEQQFVEIRQIYSQIAESHRKFEKKNCDHLTWEIKLLNLMYINITNKNQLDLLLKEFKNKEIIVSIITKLYEKLLEINS